MSQYEVKPISLAQLRTHKSSKWRDYDPDVLPLPVAEMDFPIADPIRDLLLEMVSNSDLGYLGPIPELGISFALFAQQRWGWVLDPLEVYASTDVGVGIVEILRLLTQPGDRVLLSSPIYHNFYTWVKETKVEKVDVPFLETSEGWAIDVAGIEAAYKTGIKVHLLCNPHNPLGRVYAREELLAIANLAQEHGVVVISDEIHAPLTFSESTFIPFLSIGDTAQSVGITVTAASKGWNIPGLKAAIIVTQNPAMAALMRDLPTALHYRASILGGFATVVAYEKGTQWLDGALRTLDSNRFFLKRLLEEQIPEIVYHVPNCSYLAWLDLSALKLGDNPSRTLLERGRLALSAGESFSPNTPQYVRFNFAASEEVLIEAVQRIRRCL